MRKFDEAYFRNEQGKLMEKMLKASQSAPNMASWVFGQRIDSKRDIKNAFREDMRTLYDLAKLCGIDVAKVFGDRPDESGDEPEPNSLQ